MQIDLIELVKKEYPNMIVITSEDEYSLKFLKYSVTDAEVFCAIKVGETVEIYDKEGLLVEVIRK